MVAQTTWAKRKRWEKSRVSWTLAAEGTAASEREAVGRDHDMVLGSRLAAVGGIGAGQLATALGADRTTVHHHVPGGDLRSRTDHPDQDDMDQIGRAHV